MTEDRFGELCGSVAYALVTDATAEERAEFLNRWADVGKTLPMALIVSETAIAVGREMRGQMQTMVEEAAATFGPAAAAQLALKLKR